mgnify:CR=1 FL=1
MHILDLVQNSIEAGASKVTLFINEDTKADSLIIRVADNGRGMDENTCRQVVDPFFTTRRTRRIGLGLPLIAMTTRQCQGHLNIKSVLGEGTEIEAVYKLSHIDRPPLGNIAETVKTIIIANPHLDFAYCHTVNGNSLTLATKEITDILGEISLTHPDVLVWFDQYLTDQLINLYGGVKHENS